MIPKYGTPSLPLFCFGEFRSSIDFSSFRHLDACLLYMYYTYVCAMCSNCIDITISVSMLVDQKGKTGDKSVYGDTCIFRASEALGIYRKARHRGPGMSVSLGGQYR